MPDWGRIGAGIATGGLSEGLRYLENGALDRQNNAYAPVTAEDFANPDYQWNRGVTQSLGMAAGGRQAPIALAQESAARGQQLDAANYFGQQMRGQNLLSAEQLRQAQMQNVAQQQSLQASARPGGEAQAQRMAAQNSARLGYGLSGQAAMAGIAERNAAAQNYAGALGQIRGQDLGLSQFNANQQQQGALQQTALNDAQQRGMIGLGLQNAGMQQQGAMGFQDARTSRFNALMGVPTTGERVLGAASGAAQLFATGGAGGGGGAQGIQGAMSDERVKHDVADADDDIDTFMASVKPKAWTYNDPKHGEGRQYGVMAQALEKTKAGKQAIIETPEGKAVNFGKLGGPLTAAVARLHERLAKVEAEKRAKREAADRG